MRHRLAILAAAPYPGQRYRHGWIPIGVSAPSRDEKNYSEHEITGHGLDIPHARMTLRKDKTGAEGARHKLYVTTHQEFPPVHPSFPPRVKSEDVGSMLYDPKTGRVEGIHVEPKYQRQGVATRLWDVANALHEQHGLVKPQHSETQTSEGAAWARQVDARKAAQHG